jgi:hypothetical protein
MHGSRAAGRWQAGLSAQEETMLRVVDRMTAPLRTLWCLAPIFAWSGCEELPPCSQPVKPWLDLSFPCDAIDIFYTHIPELGMCTEVETDCTQTENHFGSLKECESVCEVTPPSTPCSVTATDPSLPGVSVRVQGERCRVPASGSHTFHYVISISEPITYAIPAPSDACVVCPESFAAGPLYTLVQTAVGAGDIWYDPGYGKRCCHDGSGAQTLYPTSFSGSFRWYGSTSTSAAEPRSTRFPSGQYQAIVTFSVPSLGEVAARLPLEVVGIP